MKQITLNGLKVRVTDPSYEPNTWCGLTVDNVLPGNWNCKVMHRDCQTWGVRISSLSIRHEDYSRGKINEHIGNVAVDSGQCGFFEPEYYAEKSADNDFDSEQSWYRQVCELTLNKPDWGVIDDKGVVSRSGLGDGYYDVYVLRNHSGYVVGLKIQFI